MHPSPHRVALLPLLLLGWALTLAGPARAEPVPAVVTEPYLELHTGPGRGYPVFHVIDRGQSFEIIARRTDWFRVRGPRDRIGWAPLAQLRLATRADGSPLPLESPDADDYFARRFESGVMLGDFGGGNVLALHAGFQMTRNFAVELSASDLTGAFSDGWMLGAALIHQPFPEWRVSPFLSLGTGVLQIRPQATLADTQERTNQVASVGAGLRMHLTRRFMLRVEYENHLVITDRNENEAVDEWKAGFAFFF